jgi:hypothetical protein
MDCAHLLSRNKKCQRAFAAFAAERVLLRWRKILPNVPKALRAQMKGRMTRTAARAGAELIEVATDLSFQDKCSQLAESKSSAEKKNARNLRGCLARDKCAGYVECFMAEAGHLVGYRASPEKYLGTGKPTCEGFCKKFKQCFWTVLQASGKLSPAQMSMLKKMPKAQLDRLTDMALKSCRRQCATAGPGSEKAKAYAACALAKDCTAFAGCAKKNMKW